MTRVLYPLRAFMTALIFLSFGAPVALAQDTMSEEGVRDLYQKLWALSGHADTTSPAFTRWDADGSVPATCAGCHSTSGFLDRTGTDGSAQGSVENPVPIGETVDCATCHAPEPAALAAISFPSGIVYEHQSSSGTCLSCHQGRASADTVNAATAALENDDTVSADLRFINIHYAPAALAMGADARGGFEYPGREYAGRFAHVEGFDTCVGCHEPHSTQVKVETCSACHGDVALADIRLGLPDVDGDGDISEGAAAEIHTLHDALGEAIIAYAEDHGGPIAYAKGFPYFFSDLNGNGQVDEDERRRDNGYVAFTARLLRATYNYQAVATAPNAWAHNPRYAAQLLFDSIEDLNANAPVVTDGQRP